MKIGTVCFLRDKDKVLLAMKKRGFGVGKWNGVGGKVEKNETVEEAAVREMWEEIEVSVSHTDLHKVGEMEFHFPDQQGWDMFVHVFFVTKWTGDPDETEEMRPKWFNETELPFDEMWVDDKYWLADALAGKKLKGKFYFKGEGKELVQHEVIEVEAF